MPKIFQKLFKPDDGPAEILFHRGGEAYIVKSKGKFYLVNVNTRTSMEAKPPDSPDMFLKFGYFEDVFSLDPVRRDEILTIFNNL